MSGQKKRHAGGLTPALPLALLAGCHLLLGHAPPGRDLPAREGPALDTGTRDGPASEPRPLPVDARFDAPVVASDLEQRDAKKPDASPGACNYDGLCSTGESCAGCPDCCACGGEVDCGITGVTCVPGGTLTTQSGGAWNYISKPVLTVGGRPAGPTHAKLYLCGVDFSTVTFTGTNPYGSGWGAYLGFGVAVPPVTEMDPRNAIFFNVTSTMPTNQVSWNGLTPATHDQDYRKYLFQTWYRLGAAAKVLSPTVGHQYNVEKKLAGTERFDLRLELWKSPLGGGYVYRAWSRMHASAAKLEGCSWASAWNAAINTTGSVAWVPLGDASATQSVSPLNLTDAAVQVWLATGGDSMNPVQSLSYQRAAVELVP